MGEKNPFRMWQNAAKEATIITAIKVKVDNIFCWLGGGWSSNKKEQVAFSQLGQDISPNTIELMRCSVPSIGQCRAHVVDFVDYVANHMNWWLLSCSVLCYCFFNIGRFHIIIVGRCRDYLLHL